MRMDWILTFVIFRNDGHEDGLDIVANPGQYSQPMTQQLVDLLTEFFDVTHIFVASNADLTAPPDVSVQVLTGHSNHFHVRIADPDGTDN